MCTKNHNHMRYSSWGTEWDRTLYHFGPFFAFFALLTPYLTNPPPPNNSEKQSFGKMQKKIGDVIIVNLYNKKHDHMMYGYSDMECDRYNFLSFQAIFCSFAPLFTMKIEVWKKCNKTPGDIILLHICTINQYHMMYGS